MARRHGSIVVTSIALAVAALAGCGLYPEPEPDIRPPDPQPVIPVKVSGTYVDAETKQFVAEDIQVRVLNEDGQPAQGITNDEGTATSTLVVTGGVLSFAVASSALPMELTLASEVEGYIPSSTKLSIPANGNYEVNAELVSVANPPEGVAVVSQPAGTASATGETALPIAVATPAETNTGGTATVDLPANTILTDASGAPLSGQLTATVAYFNNQDATSMASTPGGQVQEVGGQRVALISAARTSISISDASGRQAASFDKPMRIEMSIPAQTVNPQTGVAVAAGDVMGLWSFSKGNTAWKSEGTVTLVGNGGTVTAPAFITHLSEWQVAGTAAVCATGRTLTFPANTNGYELQVTASIPTGGYTFFGSSTGSLVLTEVPVGKALTITASFNGQVVGTATLGDACSTGSFSVPVTLPAALRPASLSVTVVDTCTNSTAAPVPVPSVSVGITDGVKPSSGTTNATGTATFDGLSAASVLTVSAKNRSNPELPFANQTITLAAGSANTVTFENRRTCSILTGAAGGG